MYSDFRDQNGNSISAATVMEAIKRPVITHDVAFELYHGSSFSPFFFFDEDDIVRGSLIITNSCASDGIKLGSVNIGMLKVTVKNDQLKNLNSPNDLIDCNLSPIYKIKIDDTTTVTVMSGTYFVKEVEQLTEGIKLTCYDGMSKLDTLFTETTLTGTPYAILTQAATACGVRVQSTQAEIEALPNGTRTFTLHSDNDCKTWRDVLSYLSMLMGCFVTFGRHIYGVLQHPGIEVRPFGNGKTNFDDTVTDVHRYKGAKFSIFDTEYKVIDLTAYVVDGQDTVKKDFTYAETTGVTGQTIKLGYNPFIQADTPETDLTQTQRDMLHELLEQVALYNYTPMQISLPVGFIYDLGDVIKCTGGLANTGFAGGYTEDCYCCISNYTYTYGKEFRIKTLESKANKARPIVIPFSATLNVTVVNGTGATVTATDGTNTYTATESGGSASLTILIPGTYTVSAELDGETGSITDTVTIIESGVYTAEVGFEYIPYYVLDTLDLNEIAIPVNKGGNLEYLYAGIPGATGYSTPVAVGVAIKPLYIPAYSGTYLSGAGYHEYVYDSNNNCVWMYYIRWESSQYGIAFLNRGWNIASQPPTAEDLEGFASYGVDLNGDRITDTDRVPLPISNSKLKIYYAINQVGQAYTVTDGEHTISGIFDGSDVTVLLHALKTYTVSVEGVVYGQVTTKGITENLEIYAYTPDTMRIYTGYNDNKYVITMGDGETYNVPFETARGRVTQNIHTYTYDGISIRIEFSATETRTNAVTGTIYFDGANPFTFSADAKGSNPSYGVDTTISIPIGI